jgi:hypothetical protein
VRIDVQTVVPITVNTTSLGTVTNIDLEIAFAMSEEMVIHPGGQNFLNAQIHPSSDERPVATWNDSAPETIGLVPQRSDLVRPVKVRFKLRAAALTSLLSRVKRRSRRTLSSVRCVQYVTT